jgi:hypothetical protein
MFRDRSSTHLAAAVRGAYDFGSRALIYLALIRYLLPFPKVLVENHSLLLAIYHFDCLRLLNQEPFLQVSFAPIQMSLIFRLESFFLQFLANGSACYALRKALHDRDNLKMDLPGPTAFGCQVMTPNPDYQKWLSPGHILENPGTGRFPRCLTVNFELLTSNSVTLSPQNRPSTTQYC